MSIDEFANTTPVRPPIVNRNTNPSAHKQAVLYLIRVPYIVASHLKILIPVGTAIIIVADVKYARASTSDPRNGGSPPKDSSDVKVINFVSVVSLFVTMAVSGRQRYT
jgi:hypothetical protein